MPYSNIQIMVVDSAKKGDTVNFGVGVANITENMQIFKTECWAPDQTPASKLFTKSDEVQPHVTKAYYSSFVMPDKNAQIFVWVERWTGSGYIYDNAIVKDVFLAGVQPVITNFKIADYYKV